MQGHTVCFNEALGAVNIIGSHSMLKSLNLQAIVLIPLAGTSVVFGNALAFSPCRRGNALVQSLSQQIGEEMVIAVPASLVVQWDDEQVGTFESFQGLLPGSRRSEQNGITNGAA